MGCDVTAEGVIVGAAVLCMALVVVWIVDRMDRCE